MASCGYFKINKAPTNLTNYFEGGFSRDGIDNEHISVIDKSQAILIFITTKYISEVESNSNTSNWCKQEFDYALSKKNTSSIIPIRMEPNLKGLNALNGTIALTLENKSLIDYTSDENFNETIQSLCSRIREIITPISQLIEPSVLESDKDALSLVKNNDTVHSGSPDSLDVELYVRLTCLYLLSACILLLFKITDLIFGIYPQVFNIILMKSFFLSLFLETGTSYY